MPFEPRLVHPDDEPERELVLAPDLIELAEQLSEEAAELAAQYPAARYSAGNLSQPSAGRGPRWIAFRWQGAAAAVLVSMGVWGLTRGGPGDPQPAPVGIVRIVGNPEAPGLHNPGVVVPAAFFQDLSGPEREGLLDLMDEERVKQSSLSI